MATRSNWAARMLFYEKATAGPQRRPVDVARSPVVPMPAIPANICEFCGQTKDPLTGACACAVGVPRCLRLDPFAAASSGWPGAADHQALDELRNSPSRGGSRAVRWAGVSRADGGGSIGREPAREVALTADAMVSRRHAAITPEGGGLRAAGRGLLQRHFVNGQRIQQHLLRSGDEIRIGASSLRFEL